MSNAGEGAVVVDALVARGLDGELGHTVVAHQLCGDATDDVLDKGRGVVCLHGHEALVRTLERGIDRCGPMPFSKVYEILDPHDLVVSGLLGSRSAHRDGYGAPLVVRAIVADGAAAGAQRRHRDGHCEASRRRRLGTRIGTPRRETPCASNGCAFLDEVRELGVDGRRRAAQLSRDRGEQVLCRANREFPLGV